MTAAIELATWIRSAAAPVDHLRLQKLLFYTYGAALAHGHAREVGIIDFVAWKHGPVNPDVYRSFRGSGSADLPIPSRAEVPEYTKPLEQVLRDTLTVYGGLTSWQLRQESHLEAPWRETEQSQQIPAEAIRRHFVSKFRGGAVALPRHLLRRSSFEVDRLPAQSWATLHELAQALGA